MESPQTNKNEKLELQLSKTDANIDGKHEIAFLLKETRKSRGTVTIATPRHRDISVDGKGACYKNVENGSARRFQVPGSRFPVQPDEPGT
jgi:hypothetical protein